MSTSTRQQLIADSALTVVAEQGLRGLTHRAVDAAAGLPVGSTSYYLRTRAALLEACVQRLVELDHQEMDTMHMPEGETAHREMQLAAFLTEVIARWLTTERHRHLARFELSLEAARRPELATSLHAAGQGLRTRMSALLKALGAADPPRQARLLAACVDGILYDQIVGAGAAHPLDKDELRAACRDLVHTAMRRQG